MNFINGEIVAKDGALVFTEPSGTALTLPPSRATTYAGSVGKPVVLGIRPDHIVRDPAAGAPSVQMTVRDVEPLGPHTLVIGSVGGFPFTAQMSVGVRARPDEPFDVALDLQRAHLFDKVTGEVIPA
jgi:multiple sugar transport system ATP-binding protein